MSTGQNPPDGASINYYLAGEVQENPTIIILNQKGDTINKIEITGDTSGVLESAAAEKKSWDEALDKNYPKK